MFTIITTPPLISAVLSLMLGLFVFSKNKRSKINFGFLLISLVTFWWQFSWFVLFNLEDNYLVNIMVRIGYLGIIFIPVFMYQFFLPFLGIKEKKEFWFLRISYVLAFLFVYLLFFSDLIINDFYNYSWGYYPKAGILHFVFLIFLVTLSLRIIFLSYLELKKQKLISSYRYQQIKYVFIALIFYICSASDFLVNYGLNFYPLGFLFLFCFLGVFSYAIIRHRLMDIKMALRSSSVYLVSLGTILALVICANLFFYRYFADTVYWTNLLLVVVATLIFSPLKKKYFYLANKYFFSSLYDPQQLIADLSDVLRRTLNIDLIYNHLFTLIDGAFHPKAFAVLSYYEDKGAYYLEFNNGFDVGHRKRFLGSKMLHDELIGRNQIIVTEEVKKDFYNENTKKVIDLLIKLKIEVLVPLNIKDKTVGLLVMGRKESNDLYSEADLKILEIIGAQAATAVENAFLYEKTLNFNAKLKEEVRKATRELVKANNKLKRLDKAKSEFISIASHQLRTPLTIIKGYISMILEGNFGELTKGEKESLEKVYLSNERLIGLVENLLNISRIESGRLQFDYQVQPLDVLVNSVFEELKPKAKEKNIRFTYRKTKKKLPPVKIDEEKIRQVIMNMVDNAIKYTKKGSVTITLKKVVASDKRMGECLEFKVSDSGMGVSADDLPNLFKKFSRGTGTSLVHTEGTGLGLYVAKQMVEAHGGKVWAESKGEGKGSKFCFRIPIKNKSK